MLTGFRSWKVADDWTLRSVAFTNTWHPDVNVAECKMGSGNRRLACDDPAHDGVRLVGSAPNGFHNQDCFIYGPCKGVEQECGCGFWAYTTESDEWYRSNPFANWGEKYAIHAHGVIDGFGRCIVGPKGFRASSAIVRALVLPVVRTKLAPPYPGYSHTVEVGEPTPDTPASEALREAYSTARIYPTVEAMRAANPLSTRDLLADQEHQS